MSTIEKILRKNTMGLFSDSWYGNVTNELSNIDNKPNGYVYFIRNDRGELVKIGKSVDLESRIKGLKSGMGKALYLQGYIYSDNYHSLEKELHKEFAMVREQGEWFDMDINYTNEVIKRYNGISVNGYWSNKSKIIDGGAFNIDKVKGITNLPYWDIIFNYLDDSVIKNERIDKPTYYNECVALHKKYTSITKKKLVLITKQWCNSKGYVYRSGNANSIRYFIIST